MDLQDILQIHCKNKPNVKRSFVLYIAASFCLWLSAQSHTRLPIEELKMIPLSYLWMQTNNAAALYDVSVAVSDIRFTSSVENGSYRLPFSPQKEKTRGVSTEGYRRIGTLSLYGKLNYTAKSLDQMKWKYEMFTSASNPFVLGDSIAGNRDMETFSFDAGLAGTLLNRKWVYGIGISYKTGSSADQNDPRPLVNGVRYSIRPGVKYKANNWSFGFAAKAERYKEDIDISVLDHLKTHHYFLFMGLGQFYPNSGTTYNRNYRGHVIENSVQVEYTSKNAQHLVDVKHNRIKEWGEDGNAAKPFKSGDYIADLFSAQYLLKYKTRANCSHLFRLAVSLFDDKGVWYDQKIVQTDFGSTEWEIYNKSVKWTRSKTDFGLKYRFIREKKSRKNYTVGASVLFEKEKQTIFPDKQSFSYKNIVAELDASKNFYFTHDVELVLDASIGWRRNLSRQVHFEGIKLRNEVSLPAFAYLSSHQLNPACGATIAKRIRLSQQYLIYPYFKTRFSAYGDIGSSVYPEKRKRYYSEISFGLFL